MDKPKECPHAVKIYSEEKLPSIEAKCVKCKKIIKSESSEDIVYTAEALSKYFTTNGEKI